MRGGRTPLTLGATAANTFANKETQRADVYQTVSVATFALILQQLSRSSAEKHEELRHPCAPFERGVLHWIGGKHHERARECRRNTPAPKRAEREEERLRRPHRAQLIPMSSLLSAFARDG
jgi:hypothetical protein